MVTNYYNSSNNYSSPVRQNEPKPYGIRSDDEIAVKADQHPDKGAKNNDRVLLLGLLAVLYLTECDDVWLLFALVFLVIS